MPIGAVGFQLRALADLLQRVYAATDLSQISRCIVMHVRDWMPPEARNVAALENLEQRLVTSLEDLYLASLDPEGPASGMNAGLAERVSTAETYYQSQIDVAARMLDRAELVTADGSVIRAAGDAVADAAMDIVRRRSAAFALEIARDQEKLGAPPSLLFQLDGRIVWTNHWLLEMVDHRGLDKGRLLQSACRFAAPLCASLRRREEPHGKKRLRQRIEDMGVHFRAIVKHGGESAGEALLLVEVTGAIRAIELSPREVEVARLVAQHGSYQTAADTIDVSIDSVRTYIRRIYRKMGVSNRAQLKVRMIREGLMPSE
ncbi:MAG: LuxR C-terminal-related transcriptional regulator [Planctomycetes bacterium]|nr:LuxR C-terminal-related transcriptional regulator [Planctomycetota bacterium]